MFAEEDRELLLQALLNRAEADPRITGAAITGSFAGGTADRWSDIDLYFGIGARATRDEVLEEWSSFMYREHGALHHFDLHAGPAIYRAFLLDGGLEVDLAFTPEAAFGARRSTFQLVFGEPTPPPLEPVFDAYQIVGLAWHHILHARIAVERGRLWLAEHWLHAVRDHALTLACRRLGQAIDHGKGFDALPPDMLTHYEETLARSLAPAELQRALGAVTELLLDEVAKIDIELHDRLAGPLRELALVDPRTGTSTPTSSTRD